MSLVVYKAPTVMKWLEIEAKRSSDSVKSKSHSNGAKGSEDILSTVKDFASAALTYGKGAVGGLVQKQAEETRYELFETGFEFMDLARRIKVDYSEIRQINLKPNDRFQVLFNGGSLTIKPLAHLVSGRYKIPVGWMRNEMEVPYSMLVEELAARCGIEINGS